MLGIWAAFCGSIFAWILGNHVIFSMSERERQMFLETYALYKLMSV